MDAKITVDLSAPIGTINRNIYGHFAEHLGRCIYEGLWVGPDSDIPNRAGMRADVVDALKEIKIPVLRWPGGCFADDYHWRDGVGPREQRPVRINRWWNDEESNAFGTHEFMELCRQLECASYICGNVGSGTVSEMSDWLEYLNAPGKSTLAKLRAEHGHPAPYQVHYWGVGNENWGCGGSMGPQYYANEFKRYATYLSSYDPDRPLFKIACGASGFDYGWTDKFFGTVSGKLCECRSQMSLVDACAFHYYCGTAGKSATEYTEDEWYILLLKALAMEELVVEHRAVMDKYDPNRRVGLICDEWGTWHPALEGTEPRWLYQQNTIRDALVAALTLNVFNNHADKIVMSNIAQTVNVLQAMILTDGPRMVTTPTYHVYALYTPHHDATALTTRVDVPEVSAFQVPGVHASCSRKDDTITLTTINSHATEEFPLEVQFAGVTGEEDPKLTAWTTLAATDIHAHNTFEQPNEVVPKSMDLPAGLVMLPPASVNRLIYTL